LQINDHYVLEPVDGGALRRTARLATLVRAVPVYIAGRGPGGNARAREYSEYDDFSAWNFART